MPATRYALARPATLLIAGLLAAGAIMAAVTRATPKDTWPESRRGLDAHVVGVAANADMLFRVYSDGSVDYLRIAPDTFRKFPNGIPDWALLNIDHDWTHDRQGNPQPKQK
ncbi:MAG TPA: hypothetical protein PL072_04510 [Phycisphaerales bacterium]|nr:hypothetical protein [Phycisphaerales bacterium]